MKDYGFLKVSRENGAAIVRLNDDVPTCTELIEHMVRECREHLDAARNLARAEG